MGNSLLTKKKDLILKHVNGLLRLHFMEPDPKISLDTEEADFLREELGDCWLNLPCQAQSFITAFSFVLFCHFRILTESAGLGRDAYFSKLKGVCQNDN